MSYHTKTPDEQGMYWIKTRHDEWCLAYLDTNNERVTIFSDEFNSKYRDIYELDELPAGLVRQWYGPFACPGGDFGSQTVVAAEEDHQRAKRNKEAIVIVHVDYRHCKGEKHGASITSVATMPREKAHKYVEREAEAFAEDCKDEESE